MQAIECIVWKSIQATVKIIGVGTKRPKYFFQNCIFFRTNCGGLNRPNVGYGSLKAKGIPSEGTQRYHGTRQELFSDIALTQAERLSYTWESYSTTHRSRSPINLVIQQCTRPCSSSTYPSLESFGSESQASPRSSILSASRVVSQCYAKWSGVESRLWQLKTSHWWSGHVPHKSTYREVEGMAVSCSLKHWNILIEGDHKSETLSPSCEESCRSFSALPFCWALNEEDPPQEGLWSFENLRKVTRAEGYQSLVALLLFFCLAFPPAYYPTQPDRSNYTNILNKVISEIELENTWVILPPNFRNENRSNYKICNLHQLLRIKSHVRLSQSAA